MPQIAEGIGITETKWYNIVQTNKFNIYMNLASLSDPTIEYALMWLTDYCTNGKELKEYDKQRKQILRYTISGQCHIGLY
ncbi:hypothetical protein FACS1894111_04300 [Clostridia bacterium]|nr:hypothetical protein FACS1894111_04300 [Clostridia bacterium]